MELDEFLEITNLLEYYKNLLGGKQKEYLISHFEDDLSLSEIAENNGISRQAVYDNIKRGVNFLKECEKKLCFYQREKKLYDELLHLKKDFKMENLDKILEEMF